MKSLPVLTRKEQADRHRLLVSVYRRGHCSRTVAQIFGLTDSHVRSVLRLYGVARKPGRPSNASR